MVDIETISSVKAHPREEEVDRLVDTDQDLGLDAADDDFEDGFNAPPTLFYETAAEHDRAVSDAYARRYPRSDPLENRNYVVSKSLENFPSRSPSHMQRQSVIADQGSVLSSSASFILDQDESEDDQDKLVASDSEDEEDQYIGHELMTSPIESSFEASTGLDARPTRQSETLNLRNRLGSRYFVSVGEDVRTSTRTQNDKDYSRTDFKPASDVLKDMLPSTNATYDTQAVQAGSGLLPLEETFIEHEKKGVRKE